MYARSVVLVFTIIVSTGLDHLVCSHKDVQFIKKGAPSWGEKSRNDNTLNKDFQKDIEGDRKNLEWNARESFSEHAETLGALQGRVPGKNLRFDLSHHHHHHHFHHKKLDNELGQEEKLNSGRTTKEGKVSKFIDSGKVVKKDIVKPFGRKRYRKKRTRITGKVERRNKLKNGNYNGKFVQEMFPTYKTDKRFMVVSGPGRNASVKRNRFHFSHELVNALKLVLDKRNSFKKDANILDLAKALQSRDQESNLYRNNSITTGVSRGLTKNGQRVRVVKVKDPGYNENYDHENRLGLRNPVYRSKILQDARQSHSALVNPTELGASILKLLFGKKARFVTKPKYRHLVGAARPNMKYLEGYGSKEQRAELEKEIQKENQLIILKGVKKHELEKTLAKSISKLIKVMDREKGGSQGKSSKHDSEPNVANAEENSGQKTFSSQDRIGTRKSWVLLKMPKNNEEVEQDKVTHFNEAEKENDNPSKASTHQIATQGKTNNELSDIKVVHPHKPHVESSYDGIASDVKNPSGLAKYMHTDTESRTVPQISYNLNGIKNNMESLKHFGVNSNGLSSSLGKILKGIQESVKELKDQHKQKEASLESTTSPTQKTSHESVSMAKIQDLLVAVNKLLGGGSSSSQMPSHSEMTGIPSDQASVLNVPTADDDSAATRRYVDGVRASANPLQLRPSTGYYDEPITTSVTSRKGVGEDKSLDNVLFESDELATQRDRQATVDAMKLKEGNLLIIVLL